VRGPIVPRRCLNLVQLTSSLGSSSDHGALDTADGSRGALGQGQAIIRIDSNLNSLVKAVGLTLKVSGTALDAVNERESDSLRSISFTLRTDQSRRYVRQRHPRPGEAPQQSAGQ
jgi:hypothetical protein